MGKLYENAVLLELKRKEKEGLVITKEYSAEEKISNIKIKFTPLWKWLLDNVEY